MLLNIYDLLLPPLKLDNSKPIRLFEAFSGIGTQHMALKRLSKKYNFTLDVIGISEIDRFAIKSYNAIHGKVKNYGDISKLKSLPNNIDICTWSFPCQDLSVAGAGRGMVDGSRSNYGFDFLDVVAHTHTHNLKF